MPFPEQLDFEDYRDADGVKVPFTIRYSGIDTYDSWTRTSPKIKRNAAVEDTLFAMPTVLRSKAGLFYFTVWMGR